MRHRFRRSPRGASALARYFFHTFDGKHNAYDTDGVECPSIREVRLHMVKLAQQEVMSSDPQKETWAIEALDDRGVIVGSMDFGLLSSTDYRR